MRNLINRIGLFSLMVVAISTSTAHADLITIILETNDVAAGEIATTANLLDDGPSVNTLSTMDPLTASVAEDPSMMLDISIISATSFDPADSFVNASGAGFGINSPTPAVGSENASRFDVDAAESLSFIFNQDVRIIDVDLVSLSGDETFTFAGVTNINDTNTDGSDVFTFADGGVFVAAGTPIFVEAGGPAGSSVGIERFTVDRIAAIPEPTSFALMGLVGLGATVRRRR